MHRVPSSGGVSVALHDFGGHGPRLLISHATGFHAHCYVEMAAGLATHFHCVGLDYRGHGETTGPVVSGLAFDWQAFGDDCVAAARDLEPARGLVGFGHSMGGAALIMAAHREPGRFRALVLFEPIAFPPQTNPPEHAGESPMVSAARRRRRQFESYDDAYRNYASKPPMSAMSATTLRHYVDHGFRPVDPTIDGSAAAELGGVVLRCTPEFEAGVFMHARDNGIWAMLEDVDIPVVVVSGRVEHMQPSMIADAVAERLPNGTYVCLDDLDHFGPFTHPQRIADLTIAALETSTTTPADRPG